VRTLEVGVRLFARLLAGQEVGRGEDEAGSWIDLAWPGPGRVRLIEPAAPTSPIATWLDGREGRIHHLEFDLPGAGETREVAPEENNGARLVIRDGSTG